MATLVVMATERSVPPSFPGKRGAIVIRRFAPPEPVGEFRCLPKIETEYFTELLEDPTPTTFRRFVAPELQEIPNDLTGTRMIGSASVWRNTAPTAVILGYRDDTGAEPIAIGLDGDTLVFAFFEFRASFNDLNPVRGLEAIVVCRWEPGRISMTIRALDQEGILIENTATCEATN